MKRWPCFAADGERNKHMRLAMIAARKVDCCVGVGLRRAERRWRAARLHQSQVWDAAGTRGAHTTERVRVMAYGCKYNS